MKKDKIFIWVFAALFIIYVVVDILTPDPISWEVTFKTDDKNPFGSYILNERSADLFSGGFELSFNTLSELVDTEKNILIITEYAEIVRTDRDNLFQVLDDGGNVLIAATSFDGGLADTLGFYVDIEYSNLDQGIFEAPEEVIVLQGLEYKYPSSLILNHFELEKDHDWEVIATSKDKPVAISKSVGEGRITLVSVPYMFTNFGLLVNDNFQASAELLSYLPEENVHYTMYYKSGKGEVQTPFRYFLRQDALRWTLYLGLFLVALLLIISSWRKQRAIPVILPPPNTTVQYVKTLGALFFRERNHKRAAEKLIAHFLFEVKDKYFVQVDFSDKFYELLSAKSSVEQEQVIRTFELIQHVKEARQIEERELVDLSRKIETFK